MQTMKLWIRLRCKSNIISFWWENQTENSTENGTWKLDHTLARKVSAPIRCHFLSCQMEIYAIDRFERLECSPLSVWQLRLAKISISDEVYDFSGFWQHANAVVQHQCSADMPFMNHFWLYSTLQHYYLSHLMPFMNHFWLYSTLHTTVSVRREYHLSDLFGVNYHGFGLWLCFFVLVRLFEGDTDTGCLFGKNIRSIRPSEFISLHSVV